MKQILTISLFILFFIGHINAQKKKTNFIIFIADDVSWNDFACYGNKDAQTPNIDKLAANGIKFTNVYLTASSCSPSRNSIITGRYPHNTGAAELHTEPPLEMLSLPEVLKIIIIIRFKQGNFIWENMRNADSTYPMTIRM